MRRRMRYVLLILLVLIVGGLLLRGQSNKLIARELNLSVETVKDHVAAVLRSLGVNSRTQAVLAVSQMSSQGGITPWPPRASP